MAGRGRRRHVGQKTRRALSGREPFARSPGFRGMTEAAPETCRIDVWLWRARFFKTRGQAAGFVEAGPVRLTHQGRQGRLDKPSRLVRPGDHLVFVLNERLIELEVLGLGSRRGPAPEARALYELAPPS